MQLPKKVHAAAAAVARSRRVVHVKSFRALDRGGAVPILNIPMSLVTKEKTWRYKVAKTSCHYFALSIIVRVNFQIYSHLCEIVQQEILKRLSDMESDVKSLRRKARRPEDAANQHHDVPPPTVPAETCNDLEMELWRYIPSPTKNVDDWTLTILPYVSDPTIILSGIPRFCTLVLDLYKDQYSRTFWSHQRYGWKHLTVCRCFRVHWW